MRKRFSIGIDVGGTNLKAAVVDAAGGFTEKRETPITDPTVSGITDLIVATVRDLQSCVPAVRGVGIGLPGLVDQSAGVVAAAPNLKDWVDVPIVDCLRKHLSLPIVIDNEVNFAAVAELRFGAGRGLKDFVLLTLGTGIGGGIIINGELYRGATGFAGEVGHMVIASDVSSDGAKCTCGGRGCWESYAASRAFHPQTPEELAKQANQGDTTAIEKWRRFGRFLGIGIHSLTNVLGITTFIIGGGIARSYDLFLPAAKEEIAWRAYRANAARFKLLRSFFDNEGGVIGAALSTR